MTWPGGTRSAGPVWTVGSRLGEVGQRAIAAVVGVAEAGQGMAHAVRQGEQKAVVRQARIFERTSHLEVQAIADQDERNVVECVRIALTQFVGPDNERIVQQAAVAARLGRLRETLGEIG